MHLVVVANDSPQPTALQRGAPSVERFQPPVRPWWRRKSLWALLALGAMVRVVLLVGFDGADLHIVDEQHYNALAVNLVNTGRYALDGGELTSIRPPLYPAFLAAVYSIAGLENFTAVRALQMLLGLLLVVQVFRLGQLLYDDRVAVGAAAAVCFYPSLLGYENLLLTETLSALLACTMCVCVAQFLRTSAWRHLVALGLVWGVAALTRSVFYLFPPFLAVFLWFALRNRRVGYRLAAIATATLVFAAVLAPWSIRNTLLHKTFVTVDVMGGRNFMMGNYEHTPLSRAWDAISMNGEQAWHRVLADADPQAYAAAATQGQRDKLAMSYGLHYAIEHPALTAQRCAVKFLNFWQLERTMVAAISRGNWRQVSTPELIGWTVLFFGSYAVLFALSVVGFATTLPRDRRLRIFLFLMTAFVCAAHTATFGHSRYHIPLVPLLAVFAAAAVVHRATLREQLATWRGSAAIAVLVLIAASWCWEIVCVDAGKFIDALRG